MLDPLLLDPAGMNLRTASTSSVVSSGRGGFRQRVLDRDGYCVMTGGETYAQACHIIPHAKGSQVPSEYLLYHSKCSFQDKYLINLINHRGVIVDPPLEDINNTGNGILLYIMLHAAFGSSDMAFFQVSYSTQPYSI
jgi:hypothetical protein